MEKISDYSPVPLKTLRADEEITFDVYLYFHINKKMVRIRKAGDVLAKNKLDDLNQKNVKHIYVSKADKEAFYKYKASVFTDILKDQNLSKEEKIKIVQEKTKESISEISEVTSKEESEQMMENCSGITKTIVTEVSSSNFASAFENITNMLKSASSLMVHCANVSSLSVMFSMLLSTIEPKKIEEIATGALLHDLALFDIDEEIVKKYLVNGKMEDDEFELFKTHPFKGMAKLRNYQQTPSENILDIVYHHHENIDGTGFPRRIKAMQINYLAKLVRIANDFEINYRDLVEQEKFDKLKYILVEMKEYQETGQTKKKYDIKILDNLISNILPAEDRTLPEGYNS